MRTVFSVEYCPNKDRSIFCHGLESLFFALSYVFVSCGHIAKQAIGKAIATITFSIGRYIVKIP